MRRSDRLTVRLNLVLAVIVLLVGVNAVLAARAAQARTRARAAATVLREIGTASNSLAQGAIDQETEQRGYLITGDEVYLRQYRDSGRQMEAVHEDLAELTATDPALIRALDDVNGAITAWRAHAEDVEIAARRNAGIEGAAAAVSTGEGKALFDQSREETAALQRAVETRAQQARDRSQRAYDWFVRLVFITLGAVVAMAAVLAVLLSRWITRPVDRLAMSVERVRSGNLDQPVAVTGPAELVQIGTAVESMRSRLVTEIGQAEDARAELARANAELASSNAELETFSYSVSHDLRAPLRAIDGFSQALIEDSGDQLDDVAREHFARIRAATARMAQLIDDLLTLSRVSRSAPNLTDVDVTKVAEAVVADLRSADPDREVEIAVQPGLRAMADASLVRLVLENLLGNAWKFTAQTEAPRIEVSGIGEAPDTVFSVADNGAGFDATYGDKLFAPFQRLHTEREFSGTGIGLATVARVVGRHGGQVAAAGEVGSGATITFTLAPTATLEGSHGER